MQLRLSTILLLCTLVGTGLGWFIDRTTLEQYGSEQKSLLESELADTRVAMTPYIRARNTYFIANDHRSSKSPREFADALEFELVWSVYMLHCYQDRIDNALDDTKEALELAGAILSDLDCKSADDFLSLAESTQDKRTTKDRSASFLHGKGNQRRFRRFIEDALHTDGYAWVGPTPCNPYN